MVNYKELEDAYRSVIEGDPPFQWADKWGVYSRDETGMVTFDSWDSLREELDVPTPTGSLLRLFRRFLR